MNNGIRIIIIRFRILDTVIELPIDCYTFGERGDVMGMFCGHDHIDDYAIAYYGLLLAYGRYTGGNTVYNGLPGGNGARIVVLHESERTLDTWIRTAEGTSQRTSFPTDYPKP